MKNIENTLSYKFLELNNALPYDLLKNKEYGLCPYFRLVCKTLFINIIAVFFCVAVGVALGIVLFAYWDIVLDTKFLSAHFTSQGVLVLLGLSLIFNAAIMTKLVTVFYKNEIDWFAQTIKIKPENKVEKKPTVLSLYIKAVHDKFCPTIYIGDPDE